MDAPSSVDSVLNWQGPHSVLVHRSKAGFGFTLRHLVVYPPQSVLDDTKSEQDFDISDRGPLSRESSLEPQHTIFIRSVKEGSPAHCAGLQIGDRLVAVNGDSITGKSYQQVIALINESPNILKLLVVPKDEDILQMAYQSETGDSLYSSTGSLSENNPRPHSISSYPSVQASPNRGYSQKPHSIGPQDPYGSQQLTYGPALGNNASARDFRTSNSLSDLLESEPRWSQAFSGDGQLVGDSSTHNQSQNSSVRSRQHTRPASHDFSNSMASSGTACNIPSKEKYSFGLYFPPKPASHSSAGSNRTVSSDSLSKRGQDDEAESANKSNVAQASDMKQRRPDYSHRKTSLDETSVLSNSAKSRDFFIRYSSDKSASDARSRYSPRHSAYESSSSDTTRPTYIISRSQTVSSISPHSTGTPSANSSYSRRSAEYPRTRRGSEDPEQSHSGQCIPVVSSDSSSHSQLGASLDIQNDSSSGTRTFVVRIPYEQQSPAATSKGQEATSKSVKSYGTTFALARAPTATHIEIQKAIGKPIVSQRKYQFEVGSGEKKSVTPTNNSQNRYKSEIDKLRTQSKFSSFASRMASFEQSPDRDPPGLEGLEEEPRDGDQVDNKAMETAQPTVKMRKISTESYNHPSPHQLSSKPERVSSPAGTSQYPDSTSIRIYVSPGNSKMSSSSSMDKMPSYPSESQKADRSLAIKSEPGKAVMVRPSLKSSSQDSHQNLSSPSLGSTNSGEGGNSDSGIWVKSYQGSSEMLDMTDGASMSRSGTDFTMSSLSKTEQDSPLYRSSRPARKTSYLSAVNAPGGRGSSAATVPIENPHQIIAQALPIVSSFTSPAVALAHTGSGQNSSLSSSPSHQQPRPYSSPHLKSQFYSPSVGAMEPQSEIPASNSAHSLSSVGSRSALAPNVAPAVMSTSDNAVAVGRVEPLHQTTAAPFGQSSSVVTLRKKVAESLEDQTNKLHRRTSYLMATARDRTNTVPIEKAFSPPQPPQPQTIEHPIQVLGPAQPKNSTKLKKFFGEKVPSIAENSELKTSSDQDEHPMEIIRKGPLSCKISVLEGKKCSDRSWKPVFAVLKSNELSLSREKKDSHHHASHSGVDDDHIPLNSCTVEFARDYVKKKKNVFRLTTHQECEYLFQTEDRGTMMGWIRAIKSINEPEKAGKMDEMMATEQAATKNQPQPVEINIITSKTSPLMGHKSKKLSALSLKAKLASSPSSMRRKKSNASDKDKEEPTKKSWKGRVMKNLKKHSDYSHLSPSVDEELDCSKFQFGVPLEDCFPSPHNEYVPLIVELCTRIVEARGLEVVGVYRVPGNAAAVNALTEEFNRGIDSVNIDNEKLLDINVISSLLKAFFLKLPEPLVPADTYSAFIEANRNVDGDKRMLKLKRLLHLLPPNYNETFKHMAEHLYKVASYGNISKMSAKNLAIMFGPTLIRKAEDDTISLMTDMSDQCQIIESIILHHDWFFGPWDQDNHIPMETTVETVVPDDSHTFKDEDEEADSAISTKEIISSIVGAASKKLRSQQQKSVDSLDTVNTSFCTTSSKPSYQEQNIDEAVQRAAMNKSQTSLTSSRSISEEFLEHKQAATSSKFSTEFYSKPPITHSEPDFFELEYADADASTPPPTGFTRHASDECLLDKNDEMEISHGLTTSMSRDAIHNTLKRIGNDVYTLLQNFEQKQLKERERRMREKEHIEMDFQRTQRELEQEESHSVDDWLAVKGGNLSTHMPDLVSSSYIGETFPYRLSSNHSHSSSSISDMDKKELQEKDREWMAQRKSANLVYGTRHSSHLPAYDAHTQRNSYAGSYDESILPSGNLPVLENQRTVALRGTVQPRLQDSKPKNVHLAVDKQHLRPSSYRLSMGRRHGSLDSLIDMIDKRSSWASSDSEDGTDLLTSLTTTFDQKLQILVNPKYKLTGVGSRKQLKPDPSIPTTEVTEPQGAKETVPAAAVKPLPEFPKSKQTSGIVQMLNSAVLIDPDRPFRDPSLHKTSFKPEAKIGIASRFERTDNRALSSSPIMNVPDSSNVRLRKCQFPELKTYLGKHPLKDLGSASLAQSKRLEDSGVIILKSLNRGRNDSRPISKSEKTEMNSNLARLSKEEKQLLGARESERQENKENKKRRSDRRHGHRRHTVGGTEDFEHIDALLHVCEDQNNDMARDRVSAWEQLKPGVKDAGPSTERNLQAWIQKERTRGSTPDLSGQDNQ